MQAFRAVECLKELTLYPDVQAAVQRLYVDTANKVRRHVARCVRWIVCWFVSRRRTFRWQRSGCTWITARNVKKKWFWPWFFVSADAGRAIVSCRNYQSVALSNVPQVDRALGAVCSGFSPEVYSRVLEAYMIQGASIRQFCWSLALLRLPRGDGCYVCPLVCSAGWLPEEAYLAHGYCVVPVIDRGHGTLGTIAALQDCCDGGLL